MRMRYKIGLVWSGLLMAGLWGSFHGRQSVIPATKASLPVTDKEQITVNPENHTITILTAKGTQTLFLPDRPTTIDLTKTDQLVLQDKQWGIEHNPFVGGMYGLHHGDITLGMDMFYFHKLDLGIALGLTYPFAFQQTSVMALVSYNVWRDTRLSIGVDQHKQPCLGVTVRL